MSGALFGKSCKAPPGKSYRSGGDSCRGNHGDPLTNLDDSGSILSGFPWAFWKEISGSIPKTRCEKNCFLENLSLGTEFLGGYSLGKQCWVVGETSATREALPEQFSKTSWRHLGGVVRGFCGVWEYLPRCVKILGRICGEFLDDFTATLSELLGRVTRRPQGVWVSS